MGHFFELNPIVLDKWGNMVYNIVYRVKFKKLKTPSPDWDVVYVWIKDSADGNVSTPYPPDIGFVAR